MLKVEDSEIFYRFYKSAAQVATSAIACPATCFEAFRTNSNLGVICKFYFSHQNPFVKSIALHITYRHF